VVIIRQPSARVGDDRSTTHAINANTDIDGAMSRLDVDSPRLAMTPRSSHGDLLHGAWWPYSLDLDNELQPVLALVADRYGSVRGIMLNRAEWTETPLNWTPKGGHRTKISWYGVQDPATAVVLGSGRRLVLLVIPPDMDQHVAMRAMTTASTPGNRLSAAEILAAAAEAAVVRD
jgi:hypothetical protein